VQSCDIDVSQIIDKARQSNNNSVIPLQFSGPATVVVEGDVSVDSQDQIKTNPVFLKIISTEKVKVEGQGAIYAGVIGKEVKVNGKGEIFGRSNFKGVQRRRSGDSSS
jgi:hypothetical protein